MFIEENQLLVKNSEPVLVGFSGGADSVALLTVLRKLGYACVALHCNFHLRGAESDRDEVFARELAGKFSIPFYSIDFETTAYAAEKHLSIEMAARELRYKWFDEMRGKLNAQAIAVAHHRDDSVETFLINLIRGTGIRGLSGIPSRNGFVVRPFLSVGRDDILKWLEQNRLPYVTDSTNLSDMYTRNFIRLRVLPLLEEIKPSVKETIARTAANLKAVEAIYNSAIESAIEKIEKDDRISIPELLSCPAPETILFELLGKYGFNRTQAQDIYRSLTGSPGKIFFSATHRLVKDRDSLLLSPLSDRETESVFFIKDEKDVGHLPVELSFEKIVFTKEHVIQKEKQIAYFDYDKIHFPLILRRWRKGDWFIPFGMKGRKKISDYFTDRKISLPEKEKIWLLCCGDDVIWIVGERSDGRYCLENTTKQVLIVKKMQETV